MITTGQMTALIMAIALPIVAGLIPYYIFWRHSSKVESGMMGAIAYGVLGYFWEEIIYSFLGLLALTKLAGVFDAVGGGAVIVAFVEALVSSVFVTLGLYWGVYLTNTKQRSLFRSATVGIGFGIGEALLLYGFQLYYAVRINMGSFNGSEGSKNAILSTTTASLYVAAYRNVLMVVIFTGLALLVGKYYLEGDKRSSWLVPIVLYFFIRFTDVILNTYVPSAAAKTVFCVVLTALAAGSLWTIVQWLRTGEVKLWERGQSRKK